MKASLIYQDNEVKVTISLAPKTQKEKLFYLLKSVIQYFQAPARSFYSQVFRKVSQSVCQQVFYAFKMTLDIESY